MILREKRKGIKLKSGKSPSQKDIFYFDWDEVKKPSASHKEGVCFIPQDLGAVTMVRDYITALCENLVIPEEQTFEISLLSDELVSNAIIASFEKNPAEYVVMRWKITPELASLSVLDYGGGFHLPQIAREIPQGDNLKEFLENLHAYRKSTTTKVPNRGQMIEHMGFGRGLRIVTGLADSVIILFHNIEGKVRKRVEPTTLGTVFTVRYNIANREKLKNNLGTD